MTRFFDAHCDTIQKVVEKGIDLAAVNAVSHVTLPGMVEAGICAQVFAAWALASRLGGREDEVAMEMVHAVGTMCAQHPDRLALGLTSAEIDKACSCIGTIAAIPSLEGADPLKGEPSALASFYGAGVRLVTLAWEDNAFSGTALGSGAGLTAKGRDLVQSCEDLGVVVDVSHASDEAFWDVWAVSSKPFVASHSDCRSLCPHPRNLTDDMIRALAERGGVLGINLYPAFLSPEFAAREIRANEEAFRRVGAGETTFEEAGRAVTAVVASLPRPPLSVIVDHVLHAVNVGGEDCVGLGGDLDGVDSLPAGIDGVADYPRIGELLHASGLVPAQIDKICYQNFARVFREVMV
ncbi:MAG TPA: dipeptidase [Thermoleophilia bacterium]